MRSLTVPVALLALTACSNLADPGTGPSDEPDVPAPAVGGLTGRVLSKEFGVMGGVEVVANQGEKTTTTDELGAWTLNGLTPGLVALQLANLPAVCTVPEPRAVDLNPGGSVRVRFLVDCSGETGADPLK
jgi:hypothetical protein